VNCLGLSLERLGERFGREARGLPLAQLRPSLLPGEKVDVAA
jgi:hypothetical protein